MIEMIRTPDERFYGLPGYPYEPNYMEINGGRFHYLDEGDGEIIPCLHGEPTWSYLYRKMIPPLKKKYRVIAPDFFGFGRSDKFTRIKDYSFHLHYRTLIKFLERAELKDITLVCQDWGGLIGLSVLGKHPGWFKRVVIMNTSLPTGRKRLGFSFLAWRLFSRWSPKLPVKNIIKWGTYHTPQQQVLSGYEAPFPDEGYKAGAKAWPSLVPTNRKDDGVYQMKRARTVLKEWNKPALVMFSDNDPITKGAQRWFMDNIPTVKNEPEINIEHAGHFLQEDQGKKLADYIHDFIQRSHARERGEEIVLDPKKYRTRRK